MCEERQSREDAAFRSSHDCHCFTFFLPAFCNAFSLVGNLSHTQQASSKSFLSTKQALSRSFTLDFERTLFPQDCKEEKRGCRALKQNAPTYSGTGPSSPVCSSSGLIVLSCFLHSSNLH